MATCRITEFNTLGSGTSGDFAQIPQEPAQAHQVVTYTTATASTAFHANTRMVKLYPSADCYVLFSVAGTAATASHELLKATTDHWRAVPAGQSFKVSVYDGTS